MSIPDNSYTTPDTTPVFPVADFVFIDVSTAVEAVLGSAVRSDLEDNPGFFSDPENFLVPVVPVSARTTPAAPKTKTSASDRGFARRVAAKAIVVEVESTETRELPKTLLGSTADDAVSLTVDIMVGSPANARKTGNALVALCTEFEEDPASAGYTLMELDRDAVDQMSKLVHALGADLPPKAPAATGKAVRPLAKAVPARTVAGCVIDVMIGQFLGTPKRN